MNSNVIKYALISVSILLCFYYETIDIFGIKFSYLWKGLFLLVILKSLLLKNSQFVFFKKNKLTVFSFLHSIKSIFNRSIIIDLSSNVYKFSKLLTFPLLYIYFSKLVKEYKINTIEFLNVFVISTILSFIPFYFGLIESNAEGYNIENLGGEGTGLIGVFQNGHSCSIALSIALLCLVYLIKTRQGLLKNIFLWIIFIIGVLFIYKCYVRTGWLMLITGLLFLYRKDLITKKGFILSVMVLALSVIVSIYLIKTDKVFLYRMMDQDQNQQSTYNSESVGSGRGSFWKAGIEIFLNDFDVVDYIFGIGEAELHDRMEKKIGFRIYTHNGFLDSIIEEGILGFYIYVSVLIAMYRITIKNKFVKLGELAYSLLFCYFMQQIVQSGQNFYFDIILSLVLATISNVNYKPANIKIKNSIDFNKKLFVYER